MSTSEGGNSLGSVIGVVVIGFPFVALAGFVLALLVRVLGYHPAKGGLEATSVIAVVVGTRLIILFREHLRNPPKPVLALSAFCYLLLLLLVLARATNSFPEWLR